MPPLVSVSVDLDSVLCYHRIHGLGEDAGEARFAVLRRALPRLAEVFAQQGISATFFVVGQDLEEDGQGRAVVTELARMGHGIASHTYSHPYDLVRLGTEAMAAETRSRARGHRRGLRVPARGFPSAGLRDLG